MERPHGERIALWSASPYGFRPPRRLSDRRAGAPAAAAAAVPFRGSASTGAAVSAGAAASTGPWDNASSSKITEADSDEYLSDDDFYLDPEDDYLEPEDDYIEPEDDYINEDEYNEMPHIITRGPAYTGDQSFDRYCVFGNVVHLNYHQALQLRSTITITERPPVKDYVCTITESHINPGQAKMEFEAQYTSNYLIKFIRPLQIVRRGPWFASVAVKLKENSIVKYCKMFLGEDGKAKLTAGWEEIVRDFNLKEGHICMFSFTDTREIPMRRRDPVAWLTMEILILNEDAGPAVDIGEPEEMTWR